MKKEVFKNKHSLVFSILLLFLIILIIEIVFADFPVITWEDPTPADGATVAVDAVYLNTTIIDTTNTSAFFDFNNSLIGYWSMDYVNITLNAPDVVFDNSSYGHDAVFGGKASASLNVTTGKYGNGTLLDGVNSKLNISDNDNLDIGTSDFSVDLWFKQNNAISNRALMNHPTGNPGYWSLFLAAADFVRMRIDDGTNFVLLDTNTTITDTTDFHHLVYTLDRDSTTGGKIYLDGNQEDAVYDITSVGDLTASGDLYIGFMLSGLYFPGIIDEVKLYKRVLTPEEVNASYNNGLYRLTNNFTSLPDATYNYSAYAIDTTGNLTIDTRNVTVDTVIPGVTINLPANTTYGNSDFPLMFNVTLSESGDTVMYTLDGGTTNNTMSTTDNLEYNLSNSSMGDGSYTFLVYANDTAGNRNDTVNVSFTVDSTPPNITIRLPTSTTYTSFPLNFNVSLSENGSTVVFTLNNGTTNTTMNTTDNREYNFTNSSMADGSYTFQVYANDSFGNRNDTQNITFTIDTSSSSSSSSSSSGGEISIFSPSKEQLLENYKIKLGKNWKVLFEFNKTNHTIRLDSLTNGTATLTVYSDPKTFSLNVLETEKIDLNDDEYYDLSIFFKSFTKYLAFLDIRIIHEEIPAQEEEIIEERKSIEVPENNINLLKLSLLIPLTSLTIILIVGIIISYKLHKKTPKKEGKKKKYIERIKKAKERKSRNI